MKTTIKISGSTAQGGTYNVRGYGRHIATISGDGIKLGDLGYNTTGVTMPDDNATYCLRDVLAFARIGVRGLGIVDGDATPNAYDLRVQAARSATTGEQK